MGSAGPDRKAPPDPALLPIIDCGGDRRAGAVDLCGFVDAAGNLVMTGGPGTGKSHVATALGIQSNDHHRKPVRCFSTVALVSARDHETAQNKAGKVAETPVKPNW